MKEAVSKKATKIAVSNISRVVIRDEYITTLFKLAYKKGEVLTKLRLFPWPHRVSKTIDEDLYTDGLFTWGSDDWFDLEVYTKEYIENENWYCVKNQKVYVKPSVYIYYIDGKHKEEYFDTYEEAEARFNELMTTFELKKI